MGIAQKQCIASKLRPSSFRCVDIIKGRRRHIPFIDPPVGKPETSVTQPLSMDSSPECGIQSARCPSV